MVKCELIFNWFGPHASNVILKLENNLTPLPKFIILFYIIQLTGLYITNKDHVGLIKLIIL